MMTALQSLSTGGEDPFLPRLLSAINRAKRIDIAVAFIRSTGLILLQDAFFEAISRGTQIRILTGDYLQITEPQALRQLMLFKEQGADVRIFECLEKQSFHMKAYLFTSSDENGQRAGCAFIGSSNISRAALSHGLEWNLMVDRCENEARFLEIQNKYNTLFRHKQARPLTHQWIDLYQDRIADKPQLLSGEPGADERLLPPEPNSVQLDALKALAATREDGYSRGLVVMATGLGKTWLAAFDTIATQAKRILFVAHRQEILEQAACTFVRIRPSAKIGRYSGSKKELEVDMLFASVQTIGQAKHLQKFAANHFDYIIVDEFHHASARTYQKLLNHFQPAFLLGLTATPERTDRADILALCDNNFVFQQDLHDGIVSDLLCPFHYLGIADEYVDYQEISWRNGRFDPNELNNKLATHARARHAFATWQKHSQKCTLAFCISQKHADFMADYFIQKGINAAAVHSGSDMLRNEALAALAEGKLSVVFSVDLFNEGVDLPRIDTVLMLRPTESKIIFLQQLGRGLRKNQDKDKLVVIDFIGNHISFFKKPEALFHLGASSKDRRDFINNLKAEKLPLPPGCFVNYEPLAINFMEKLIATRIDRHIDIYRALKNSSNRRPTLAEFYHAGGGVAQIRNKFGQWFLLARQEDDLTTKESNCLQKFASFFLEIEKSIMTKSFKMILLEAFLELDGFGRPLAEATLALRSYQIMQRRKPLLDDLPERFSKVNLADQKDQKAWQTYWRGNPVNAWIGGNRQQGEIFFSLKSSLFKFKQKVLADELDTLAVMVQELVNYRLAQYEDRLIRKKEKREKTTADIIKLPDLEKTAIPFFPDLQIACGHFTTSGYEHDNLEQRKLPTTYGTLDPNRHFIAPAKGNSMNGGRMPIRDGDYLLMERITSENAGSISSGNNIILTEVQDVAGYDQYLLRKIKKLGTGSYQLIANNPKYEPIMATEEMRTLARFIAIINPDDMLFY